MERKNYIVSLRYENYELFRDNQFKVIGFPEKCKVAELLQPGDRLVLYIASRKSKIAGILEISKKLKWCNDLIFDDFFPRRYETKVICMLEENKMPDMGNVKNHLSFIDPKNKKWGVYFMKALVKITKKDYNYIYDVCKRSKCNVSK